MSQETVWKGLLPKEETHSLLFLQNNPLFDGRNVIVGILDTGVDPGADGLQITSDGKPKVIDIMDCSGSGDVSMSPPVIVESDGNLKSISGDKLLKVNPIWKNPTGKYRLGVKRAFEFFPKELVSRLRETRKKEYGKELRMLENKLQKQLLEMKPGELLDDLKCKINLLKSLEKDIEDPGPIYDCLVWHDGDMWQAAVDTSETGDFAKANVSPMTDYHIHRQYSTFSNLDCLNYCVNIYDEGSILSIVVDAGAHGSHVAGIVAAYHPNQLECNGVAPGAQIISFKIGDTRLVSMETCPGLMRALTEAIKRGCNVINLSYGEAASWCDSGAFNKLTNDLVKKHNVVFVSSAGNNGPAMSTVGCPGGTTSACIGVGALVTKSLMSSAYSTIADLPEVNYQWSSVGPTLEGALGVDIIAPGGAITCVPNWTLNKKQLMNGTSMSSPNATGCISLLLSAAKATGMSITSTSIRRAVENSALLLQNVDILGQGSGLIQVDNAWKFLQSESKNPYKDIGFNISCGGSYSFSKGIYLRQPHESSTANTYSFTITPEFPESSILNDQSMKFQFEMRLSLESTAPSWIIVPKHALLLQAGKSIAIHVDPRNLATGVHVEFVKVFDTSRPYENGPIVKIPIVVIKPELVVEGATNHDFGLMQFEPGERIRRFICPPRGCTYIDMIVKDPRVLSRGYKVNKQENNDEPSDIYVNDDSSPVVDSDDNAMQGAHVSNQKNDDGGRMIVIHTLQVFRGTPYRDNECHKYVTLTPGSEHVISFAVHEEVTLEVVVGRAWACIGQTECEVELIFRGVTVLPPQITMTGGQKVSEIIRLFSPLNSFEISPSGKLEKWISCLKPQIKKVSPLGERDILPDSLPVYQLILEYETDLIDSYDVICRFPGLQGVLYESDFLGQLFMIYDCKKRLVGTGDAWPKAVKLTKGKHTIRMQVRHTSTTILENLMDMPCLMERPLKSPINLTFFESQTEAMVGNDKMNTKTVHLGNSISFYMKEPTLDSLPKAFVPGDVLTGSVTYIKKGNNSVGSTDRPKGYPVKYICSDIKPAALKLSTATVTTPSSTSTAETVVKDMNNLVKDTKIKHLKSLIGEATFQTIYDIVSSEYPDETSVRQIQLNHHEKIYINTATQLFKLRQQRNSIKLNEVENVIDTKRNQEIVECIQLGIQSCKTAIEAANALISSVDVVELAKEFGTNVDKDNESAVTRRKDMEAKKCTLCESTHAKAKCLLILIKFIQAMEETKIERVPDESSITTTAENSTNESTLSIDELKVDFNITYKELQKWDDVNLDKYSSLQIGRYRMNSCLSLALKKLSEHIQLNESKISLANREVLYQEKLELLEKLEMTLYAGFVCKWNALASVDAFGPF